MRFKTVGNKVDKAFVVVRNPSSTVTIPFGAPCYFTMTATGQLGVDVQNCNSAAGVGQNFFAGVVSDGGQAGAGALGLGPGLYGEAQVFGFVQSLRIIAQTRASSSASFSTASGAIGDILKPLTGTASAGIPYDAWSDIGSDFTFSANSTVNAITLLNQNQYAILAQTFTAAGLASSAINSLAGGTNGSTASSGSTILFSTISVNAFLAAL
jgi:hypothetical protein